MLILSSAPGVCAPKRVVSTFLCTDEYVWRLVPREHIAALSFEATDRHPVVSTIADAAAGIPTIRPSAETVMNHDPDLVVMYAGTMPALHAALASAHVAVLDVPWASTLDDVRRVTAMLGEKLDARARAAALLAEMDAKLAHAPKLTPPVRTLIYEANGYTGTGAMTTALMARAGLEDVAAGMGPTRLDTVPVENILANPPELLILSGDARAVSSRADLVPHHPALAAFKGTAAWAKLTPLLCPGPWSADAVATFAALGAKARAR
ncbi:MAG TPA: ABC transporter substrate-binding protein [Rhizomicrobium sp.]|nr:ABC transporter substrate-binding protein [Rhizomicrobium sp.]